MTKVINLRGARKAQLRVKKRAEGNENAMKFGRTKSEKHRDEGQKTRLDKHLDGTRRETE